MAAPSYLTRNHLGIWQFQSRIPHSGKLIRKSTGTRDRTQALRIARAWRLQLENQWGLEATMPEAIFNVPAPASNQGGNINATISAYLTDRESEVAKSTLKEFGHILGLFSDICALHGLTELQELTRESMKAYAARLASLPPNRHKTYPDKTLAELLKMKHERTLTPNSIQKYVVVVKNFLKWVDDEQIMPTDPLVRGLKTGKKARVTNERIPYTKEQVCKLLLATADHPRLKWATIIAAFTGMRQREILGLHKSDVQTIEGIPVFWVHRNLKTAQSQGYVPVADKLIEVNFLEWVKKQPDGPLFNEEMTTVGYSRFSKEYQRFQVKVLGPKPEGKLLDMHSHRHTLRTMLANSGCAIETADMITRHSNSKLSVGQQVYNHYNYLKEMKQALDRVDYGLDLVEFVYLHSR
jgi:integrase